VGEEGPAGEKGFVEETGTWVGCAAGRFRWSIARSVSEPSVRTRKIDMHLYREVVRITPT
jgi:hypothetical protein